MFKENNKFSIDRRDLVAALVATGIAVVVAGALNQQNGGISNLGRPSGKLEQQNVSFPGLNLNLFRK